MYIFNISCMYVDDDNFSVFQGCRDILRMVLEKSQSIPVVGNVSIMSQINVLMDVSLYI